MLDIICREIRNYFDSNKPKLYGDFTITDGKITDDGFYDNIQLNQYFYIEGSVFNDGVYKYTSQLTLTDETFNGTIGLMAIPKAFLDLVSDIEAWQKEYGAVDSYAMSPYNSESFGGYSYSKGSNGGAGTGGGSSNSWQSAFRSRLKQWMKI